MLMNEILKQFGIEINLPQFLYTIEVSDVSNGILKNESDKYIITTPNCELIINPNDHYETISDLIIKDNEVIGGNIYGADGSLTLIN